MPKDWACCCQHQERGIWGPVRGARLAERMGGRRDVICSVIHINGSGGSPWFIPSLLSGANLRASHQRSPAGNG